MLLPSDRRQRAPKRKRPARQRRSAADEAGDILLLEISGAIPVPVTLLSLNPMKTSAVGFLRLVEAARQEPHTGGDIEYTGFAATWAVRELCTQIRKAFGGYLLLLLHLNRLCILVAAVSLMS